jgi:quercetin dioxygenase-like cupin family protein
MDVAKRMHGKLRRFGIALFAAALILSLVSGSAQATPPSGSTSEVIARGTLPAGTVYVAPIRGALVVIKGPMDLATVHVTVAPGGSIGWHSHPGPTMVAVKAGTVTLYEARGCTRRQVSAGGAFAEQPGDVHLLRNEGSVTAETIVTFIVPVGAPVRIDQPQPSNCPVS